MELFNAFLNRYPPCEDLKKPDSALLKKYQGILPQNLLDFWKKYGFGNYGDGFFKIIDPDEYKDNLNEWLCGESSDRIPIMLTGFGNIIYYRKISEDVDDVCMVNIHYRNTMLCAYSFEDFFNFFFSDEETEEILNKKLFNEAIKKLGKLEEKEIFYFAPALAWGGSEKLEFVKKGSALVHQVLLLQM